MCLVGLCLWVLGGWIEPSCTCGMACNDGYLICMVDGEVAIDEDEKIRNDLGEG